MMNSRQVKDFSINLFTRNLFYHEGHEVHKVGLSDGSKTLLSIFTREGLEEVIELRHAINLSDLCVLCV